MVPFDLLFLVEVVVEKAGMERRGERWLRVVERAAERRSWEGVGTAAATIVCLV